MKSLHYFCCYDTVLVGLNLVFCANNSFCVTNGLQTCHCFCAWICHMNAWKLRSRLSHFWNPWFLWNLMQFFFQGHRKHLEHFTFCSHSGLNLIILCCSHISVGDNQNEGIYIFYRTWLKNIIKSNCQWKLFLLRTLQSYGTWPIINYFYFLPTGVFICCSFNYFWWKWVFKAIYWQQAIRKQTCPWCCGLCCIVWGNAWIIVNQIKWMRKFFPLCEKLKLWVKY